MSTQQQIIINEREATHYDGNSKSFVTVSLPESVVNLTPETYQYRNIDDLTQVIAEQYSDSIVRTQFADKRATASHYLHMPYMFPQVIDGEVIQWDEQYLIAKGLEKPKLNALTVWANIIISARPTIKNEMNLRIGRLWCLNGATKTVWERKIAFPDNLLHITHVELPNVIQQQTADLTPDVIEAEIMGDKIIPQYKAKQVLGEMIEFYSAHFPTKRKQEVAEFSNRFLADRMRPVSNVNRQWFHAGMIEQLQHMEQYTWDRDVTVLDVDNAVTNVLNHGAAAGRQNQQFALERIANTVTYALAENMAMRVN